MIIKICVHFVIYFLVAYFQNHNKTYIVKNNMLTEEGTISLKGKPKISIPVNRKTSRLTYIGKKYHE